MMKKHLLITAFIITGLFSTTVTIAQVTAYQPDDLEVCDDDNDGFARFNLFYTVPQILNGQPFGDFYYSFYETLTDATNAVNPIAFASQYNNTLNPQTIFARLESIATGEFDTTSFDLIVNDLPVTIPTPTPLIICDDDNDGYGWFTLTDADEEITGGNPNITVTYHYTFGDAFSGQNTLSSPYFNDVPFSQTLHVRVFNQGIDCFTIITIGLIVHNSPVPVTPTPLEVCDEDNDGFAMFMLTDKDIEIIGGEPGVTVSYYETQLDAEFGGSNNLSSPYVNIPTPTQVIYARVEDNVTSCFAIVELLLIVLPTPEINTVDDLILVDENGDGIEIFDLTVREAQILNGQSADISYYESQADADTNINPIANPTSYINSSNPQSIYYRLENVDSCYSVGSFILILVDALIDEEPDDLFIDEGDGDGLAIFDLTVNEAQMLGDQNPAVAIFTYHTTFEDSDNGINSIATPTAYQNITNPQTIYVRLTNNNTGFYVLTSFAIETDGILDVEDNFSNSFKIYPNPATEIINIQSSNLIESVELSIYNLQGQELVSDYKTPENGNISVDLSGLSTGIYFIKIASEDVSVVKRIVKQ